MFWRKLSNQFREIQSAEGLYRDLMQCRPEANGSYHILLHNNSEVCYTGEKQVSVYLVLPGDNELRFEVFNEDGWIQGVYQTPELRAWVFETLSLCQELAAQREREQELNRIKMLGLFTEAYKNPKRYAINEILDGGM